MCQNCAQLERQFREKTSELQQMDEQRVLEIEKRMRAEEALQKREQMEALQSEILKSVRDPLWATDSSLKIIYWNDAATATFGWNADEVQGRHTDELFRTLVPGSRLDDVVANLLQTGDYFGEVICHCKDGNPIFVEASSRVVRSPEGEVARVVHTARDITRRKLDQETLTFQANILKNLHDAIIVTDEKHTIIYWNKISEEIFGWKMDEVIGKLTEDVFKPVVLNSSSEKTINKMMKYGFYKEEAICRHKDCHEIYVNVHSSVLRNNEGNFIGTVSTFRDITIQKMAGDALHKSNEVLGKAIQMKDEFLSLISHEFKTPLTVINAAVQTMRLICKDELTEKGDRFLNSILQNSNRQLKLVNNLLDITCINTGNIKINKLNIDIVLITRMITESIIIIAEQKGIKLSFSSTLKKKVIGIDEEKYERILLNLLSNAIKFTQRGKSIFVMVSQKVVDGKSKVYIQVKDQGIGIPKAKQQLIFERFGQVDNSLTRQAEGTGIGLSLVKMFVEILDGEIEVKSKVGKGSTFTVLFPVTKIKETPTEKMLHEINDNRLIRAKSIEFSDIY